MKKKAMENSGRQNYLESLFLLRTLYRVYLNLLTMFCTRKVYICNDYNLNEVYLRLSQMIEDIGNLPDFKNFKEDCGRPFTSLLVIDGEADSDFDICWEYGIGRKCSQIYSKIEEKYIKEGLNTFDLKKEVSGFIKQAEEKIGLYKTKPELIMSNRMLTIKGIEDRFIVTDTTNTGADSSYKEKKSEGQKKNDDFSQQGDISLDRHILLRSEHAEYFLLMHYKDKKYLKKERISPQAYQIIRYCFEMKDRAEGFKLDLLVARSFATNSRTITDRIREINQLCKANKVRNIFHKHPEHKWGLNKDLSCFD